MIQFIAFFIGGICVLCFYVNNCGRKRQPLPPYCKASMLENIRAGGQQKTLYQLERHRRFFANIDKNSCGGNTRGFVYQQQIPFNFRIIMVSDYMLARYILTGDSEKGIKEGEKPEILKAVNFLDRNANNLVTHKTSNKERERARKFIAPAFSTTNLNHTWPHIKGVIAKEFDSFRSLFKSGEVLDVKTSVVLFFMRTLSRGAFGIEFTDDGTETELNIDGLEYLKAIDTAAQESSLEILIPFRKYMFWEQGVQDNIKAVKTLRRMAEKVLKLHAAKHFIASVNTDGTQPKPISVLDHIAQHAYSSEVGRLSDVSIFTFAGIDTTAYTFCFLLMEMCKNPSVKTKLQAELATFMPPRSAASCFEMNDKELLSAIAGCEYLTWCIKEVLRLWPVAAGGPGRELVEDLEYNGMLLPKGSLVIANFYAKFRERWIDQPDAYLPESWSDSNPQLPQLKEMLMPFSLGKRACIGQNMAMFQLRIVAAHFLHYFDFELAAEPTFEYFLTLKPDQLLMRVHERI